MRNRRYRGLPLMVLGALLMLAALLMALWNQLQERRAGDGAAALLTELQAELPGEAHEEAADMALTVSDAEGNPVDGPMDADGAPMFWPLDADGRPVDEVTDAAGRTVRWPSGAARSGDGWTVTAAGLLPWVAGPDGVTAQWPLNAQGLPCALAELRA